MTLDRRTTLALLAALCAGAAHAQAWPNKTIRMIVPLAAGSAVDNAARIVAQKMGQNLGQAIVVDNRPGAAGLIGAGEVAKAAPDGYTLGGFNDSIMTMVPNLNPKMPWDILKDFEPVSLVATVEWGLVVNADATEKSAADLIATARKSPGAVNYGSGGNGSPQHIAMALFASQAGVQMKHVPYKGAGPATTDLIGGQVDVIFDNMPSIIGHIKGGSVRALGVTTAQRSPAMPDVPTVAETVPGYEASAWFGAGAPKGTPPAVIARLNREINAALADPGMRAKLAELGGVPIGGTPEQFWAIHRMETEKWAKVVQSSGAKVE
jgi:tripartite-type tricarboxylate transporter receptor subunit TctC